MPSSYSILNGLPIGYINLHQGFAIIKQYIYKIVGYSILKLFSLHQN